MAADEPPSNHARAHSFYVIYSISDCRFHNSRCPAIAQKKLQKIETNEELLNHVPFFTRHGSG